MPFWQSSTPASPEAAFSAAQRTQDPSELAAQAQAALTKARRNLLGAGLLLLAAFLLVPWVLDKKPRAWGDDVILNMPKAKTPMQKTLGASAASGGVQPPAPIDSTSPLKPSQPAAQELAGELAAPDVKTVKAAP